MATNLINHLQQQGPGYFDGPAYNEIVIMLYMLLSDAVRDQADQIVLTETDWMWLSGGKQAGSFTLRSRPRTTFHNAIDEIIARDHIVRHFIQLSSTTATTRMHALITDE